MDYVRLCQYHRGVADDVLNLHLISPFALLTDVSITTHVVSNLIKAFSGAIFRTNGLAILKGPLDPLAVGHVFQAFGFRAWRHFGAATQPVSSWILRYSVPSGRPNFLAIRPICIPSLRSLTVVTMVKHFHTAAQKSLDVLGVIGGGAPAVVT